MIEQLRVRLENRPGTLAAMLEALAAARVDVKALEVSDRGAGDHGEAHLVVDDVARARRALEDTRHDCEVEQVLAVEMDDRVGGLASVLAALAAAGVSVKQLYAFVSRVEGKSLSLVSVDDPRRASEVLLARGVHLLSRKALERRTRAPAAAAAEETTLGDHLGLDFIW